MENEKLFEKMKITILQDRAGSEDWNPETVWKKIENGQKRELTLFWLVRFAACLVLGFGVSFLFSGSPEIKSITTADSECLDSQKTDISEEKLNDKLGDISIPDVKVMRSDFRAMATLDENIGVENERVEQTNSDTMSLPFSHSMMTIPVLELPEDSVHRTSNHPSLAPLTMEKVLVADIQFPIDKKEDLPALRQIFETARRERESRKMRVQIGSNRKRAVLWTFVQHSFIENSFVPDSEFVLKKTQ